VTPDPQDAAKLIEDYFLRDLSAEELAQLEQALQTSPELRYRLHELAQEEWLLTHIHSDMVPENVTPIRPLQPAVQTTWQFQLARLAAVLLFLIAAAGIYHWSTADSRFNPISLHRPSTQAIVDKIFTLPGDQITATHKGEEREVSRHSLLHTGDTIKIPKGARLAFTYASDETSVHVQQNSRFTLGTQDGAKQIRLTRGELIADVEPQPEGKPMRVLTADAEAIVLGTSFEIQAGKQTRLAVLTGKVGFHSHDQQNNLEVEAGYFAESDRSGNWQSRPFQMLELQPIADQSINESKRHKYIAVDPHRNFSGFLKFDLDSIEGNIVEARLRLRVERYSNDYGGEGTVRLYSLPANTTAKQAPLVTAVEVASYTGKVGAGMNLEFQVNTEALSEGIHAFLIQLDPGGNDFWFSSSKGKHPPQLRLKIEDKL